MTLPVEPRASDAERETAVARLREGHVKGRGTPEIFSAEIERGEPRIVRAVAPTARGGSVLVFAGTIVDDTFAALGAPATGS
ncbi:MAG TPA: hypothetical protein VG265_02820 [Gaiellaceae bacterium]|nr:hypothetical protein [Gaiellaceae bacterium]